ncbi:MAG: hypothetical protein MUC50_22345 [Myxococcota bacterium]|nr:hypothetical protein [Myxococcota bacterium]
MRISKSSLGFGFVVGCFAFLFVLGCEDIGFEGSDAVDDLDFEDRAASVGHTSNTLTPGTQLNSDEYLRSSDGSHSLYLQGDGNLVLRRMSDKKALWSSGTSGKSVARFKFQGDANLVLQTSSGAAVWSTKTAGSGATKLYLHSAGQLVLYKNSTVVWSVNGAPPSDPGDTDVTPGSGTVKDLEFVNFSSLPRSKQLHTFTNVTAKYIVYDESNGREGYNDIKSDQPGFVGMSGATLVGYGGGRDKYLALFRVTSKTVVIDLDKGQDDDDGGAAHALFIKTAKTLTVAEARSVDPSGKAESVPSPRTNEVMIYAEDEGGKGDRDARFGALAYKKYGSGDDLLYVFAKTLGSTPNGNGAIMRLKIQ